MYRKPVLERRLEAIKSATHLTQDEAVIIPYRLQVLTLINQLEGALNALRTYDKEITQLASQHPDFQLFNSLPGAGTLLAPRLLVAFGEQRDRFTSAAQVQKYSGIAPVTERSGNKAGYTGDGSARRFCAKPSLSGRHKRSTNPIGQGCSTINSVRKAVLTKPRYVPLRSSGYEYFIVAGKHEHLMMKPSILRR